MTAGRDTANADLAETVRELIEFTGLGGYNSNHMRKVLRVALDKHDRLRAADSQPLKTADVQQPASDIEGLRDFLATCRDDPRFTATIVKFQEWINLVNHLEDAATADGAQGDEWARADKLADEIMDAEDAPPPSDAVAPVAFTGAGAGWGQCPTCQAFPAPPHAAVNPAASDAVIPMLVAVAVDPQPHYIDSSGRWCWPLPEAARFPGCCTEVVTASREWWEYAPSEAKPHPHAQAVQLRDGEWVWLYKAATAAPRDVTDEMVGRAQRSFEVTAPKRATPFAKDIRTALIAALTTPPNAVKPAASDAVVSRPLHTTGVVDHETDSTTNNRATAAPRDVTFGALEQSLDDYLRSIPDAIGELHIEDNSGDLSCSFRCSYKNLELLGQGVHAVYMFGNDLFTTPPSAVKPGEGAGDGP